MTKLDNLAVADTENKIIPNHKHFEEKVPKHNWFSKDGNNGENGDPGLTSIFVSNVLDHKRETFCMFSPHAE